MNDEAVWHRYYPTARLRFVERDKVLADPHDKIRILQQLWQHEETGREVWRDVPLSSEDSK